MRVLVYGAGVIGGYLAHVLCRVGNEVTVLARGRWREQLEGGGLRIRHHLQRRETLDRPRVIGSPEEGGRYDAVFAVMPYHKMGQILGPLAACDAPLVILVGNDPSPAAMERTILEGSSCKKQVLFGFQATAGRRDREKGLLVCERAGAGGMDLGSLHGVPDPGTRETLASLFRGTGYRLRWQPDMEAYLTCHLAAVLPICHLAYACGGDMTRATAAQRRLVPLASREAFGALASRGVPLLPTGIDRYYLPGPRGALTRLLYFLMEKDRTLGDLIACEHCRNAPEEMELLDRAFESVLARAPDYPMPSWRALKAQAPGWAALRRQFGPEGRKGGSIPCR